MKNLWIKTYKKNEYIERFKNITFKFYLDHDLHNS